MRVSDKASASKLPESPAKKDSRAGLNTKCQLFDDFYAAFPSSQVARYARTHVHGGQTVTWQLHGAESCKVTCSSGLQNVGQQAGMGLLTVESKMAGEPVRIPFAKASSTGNAGGFSLRTRFAVNRTAVTLPTPPEA